PLGRAVTIALWRANNKPPVELVVANLEYSSEKWLIKAVGSSPGPFFSSFEVPRTNESLAYTDLYRGF
ncbi:hypothetical protein, partial [Fusicatenibacter saccharivorans]|uniref:hypothetical protein n=1 Tax=Fusicatenibacter saccharivorans TaxID=1150298 RepID=UPI001A9B8536